jgi:hypothetical protein
MRAKFIQNFLNEERTSTFMKLLNTAERDGYIKGMEKSAQYVMDAAMEIAKEYDKLHPEAQKTLRDAYYKKFLKKIHKWDRF